MPPSVSPLSVLLYVDDEPALLDVGKIYLEMDSEFVVDVASSAHEALSLLKSKAYDAIISDYQMPGMNGIDLLKRVRSEGNQIPFIIFTGKGREEVVIEALNNGADFYLQKGGDPKALYTELVHITRQSIQMKQIQMDYDEQQQRIHDLQNAQDMIQSVGPDGHFFYVNRRWLDTLGYREEDVSALTLFDIIHEESLQHCMEMFQRVMAGENVGIIDAIFRTSDGKKLYVEGIVDCKTVDGEPQYTRGLFKDVTERKRSEQAIQTLVRSMVGTSGLASLKTINENIGSWLGANCVMIGEISPDGDRVNVLSMILDGEDVFDFSYTLRGTPCENVREKGFCMYPDDAVHLFPESKDLVDLNIKGYVGTPLRNAEGEVIGILCALSRNPMIATRSIQEIMDIVAVKAAMEIERIQMDHLLHDNERKLADAMNMANLANWELDLHTKTFTFNDRFYSLHATTAEDEGGYHMDVDRYAREFIPSDERAILFEEIEKAILATELNYISEREHRIIRRDGAIRYIIIRLGIIRDAQGRTIRSYGASQDITERKEAEIGVQKSNKKLTLLSGITRHDINNQLTILSGYTELLRMKISDPSYESSFLGIANAIDRINEMISFTREYEQIGVLASAWQSMDQIIADLAGSSIPPTIRLENELPEKMEIFADPLVTKVFFNLIDNSLRHGGEVSTIRLSLVMDTEMAKIVYEDDGTGVPNQDKETIFGKGFGKNTGYGLALSREILDITGITIIENGVFGKGSRFEIALPMAYCRLN